MMSWLAVQPTIQYVINPGTDAGIKNATVLGIRFEFAMER
jgi:porin